MTQERIRVLVAEDNIVNQRLIQRLLEKLGCQVDIAADGRQALERASELKPDLILMDCSMPEMDGYEATLELRKREGSGRRTPVLALTGNSTEEDRQQCLAAGMDDFLTKPVAPEQLRAALVKWGPPPDGAG